MIESYVEIQKKQEIQAKARSLQEAKDMYDKFKKLNLQALQSVLKNLPDISTSQQQHIDTDISDDKVSETELLLLEARKREAEEYKAFEFDDPSISTDRRDDDDEVTMVDGTNMSLLDMMNSLDDEKTMPHENVDISESTSEAEDVDAVYEKWDQTRERDLARLMRPTTAASDGDSSSDCDANTERADAWANRSETSSPPLDAAAAASETAESEAVDFSDPGLQGTQVIRKVSQSVTGPPVRWPSNSSLRRGSARSRRDRQSNRSTADSETDLFRELS